MRPDIETCQDIEELRKEALRLTSVIGALAVERKYLKDEVAKANGLLESLEALVEENSRLREKVEELESLNPSNSTPLEVTEAEDQDTP